MNFEQAREFRSTCLYLVGTSNKLKEFPYEIEFLIIAPKGRTAKERMTVFALSHSGIYSNELALKKFGFLNDDLSIYVLGENRNIRYDKLLSDYLEKTGQKPSE